MTLWRYEKDGKPSELLEPGALAKLLSEGVVSHETRVWRRGLERWEPLSRHRGEILGDESPDAEEPGEELGTCAHCGERYPRMDLLPYGDVRVAAEHKEAFVREVMEMARVELRSPDEQPLEYVGFWWRVLARGIDTLALLLPSHLFQVPFYFLLRHRGANMMAPETWSWDVWTAYAASIIGSTLVAVAYEVWMLKAYRATLGKIAIGAIVTRPDGGRLSFMRAMGRWLARDILGMVITLATAVLMLLLFAFIGGIFSGGNATVFFAVVMVGSVLGTVLGFFPFAMCGWDAQKRCLHDRVAATRVVRKPR